MTNAKPTNCRSSISSSISVAPVLLYHAMNFVSIKQEKISLNNHIAPLFSQAKDGMIKLLLPRTVSPKNKTPLSFPENGVFILSGLSRKRKQLLRLPSVVGTDRFSFTARNAVTGTGGTIGRIFLPILDGNIRQRDDKRSGGTTRHHENNGQKASAGKYRGNPDQRSEQERIARIADRFRKTEFFGLFRRYDKRRFFFRKSRGIPFSASSAQGTRKLPRSR